jgi:hypothetical protein
MKIVGPCLVDYWKDKLKEADLSQYPERIKEIYEEFKDYRVLDPACGSGNFLLVAYKELKAIENKFFKLYKKYACLSSLEEAQSHLGYYDIRNLHGIECNKLPTWITKVSLWIVKHMMKQEYELKFENPLPLQDLKNIITNDALFVKWPNVDVVIGNPPFLGGTRIRTEKGNEYTSSLKKNFKDHNNNADYCTYWYKKVLSDCPQGIRVGFVSTNTITQNNSREESLDKILKNGGTIFNAYKSFKWPGSAVVHVSIVNFINQKEYKKEKKLEGKTVFHINSRLISSEVEKETRTIQKLSSNKNLSFKGIEFNGKGFVLSNEEGQKLIQKNPKNSHFLRSLLIGRDINQNSRVRPTRMIIDFQNCHLEQARKYPDLIKIIEELVKPERAKNQNKSLKQKWWLLASGGINLRKKLKHLNQFIVTSRVSVHRIFVMIQNDGLLPESATVTITSDSYSFLGILSSKFHIEWAKYNSSTMKNDTRYTNTTCFETFPFPEEKENHKVASVMEKIELYRREACQIYQHGLTTLYNQMLEGGHEELRLLHQKLDESVAELYQFPKHELKNTNKIIDFLIDLNQKSSKNQISKDQKIAS